MKFSIIVPVFNRPQEIDELLESLSHQEYRAFEVIVIEDGSSLKCDAIVNRYRSSFDLQYFFKSNTGPGDSRNFGASKANGDYLVFFDSDCIIPPQYLSRVNRFLMAQPLDAYGGPDKAPDTLTNVQQAINYSMTSFLTTGGIRGHRSKAKSFVPRSFNMGIRKQAFEHSSGFSDLHPGEDPDLIYRLSNLGYTKGLITDAFVYHKRRINFSGFAHQVYKFGLARTILMKRHPASRKWVFYLPTMALIAGIILVVQGIFNPCYWYLIGFGVLVILVDALFQTGNLITSILAIPAVMVQISSYGWGFLKGWWNLLLWKRSEKERFPEMFKGQNHYF